MAAPPATYYAMLEARLPGHGEPVAALQARGGTKGVASLCIGGGEAVAVAVELV